MKKTLELELKVGAFVMMGLIGVLVAIVILGASESMLVRKNKYVSHFNNIEGLVSGAKVVMGGLQVGVISSIEFDVPARNIAVTMQVQRSEAEWIRGDSLVQIQTQGMLGDKFIEITRGTDAQPALASGAEIPTGGAQGLSQFLTKSDQLLVTLQSIAGSMDRMLKSFEHDRRSERFFDGMAKTAQNLSVTTQTLKDEVSELQLKKASKNLNDILGKVNSGVGTLGALVNDPGLYDDAKALLGGANRNRVVRNLVRQTVRKNTEAPVDENSKK